MERMRRSAGWPRQPELSALAALPSGRARGRPVRPAPRRQSRLRDLLAVVGLARAAPPRHADASSCAPRAGCGIDRDLVADLDRLVEGEGIDRHRGRAAPRPRGRRHFRRQGPSAPSASRQRYRRPDWCRRASPWCGWPPARADNRADSPAVVVVPHHPLFLRRIRPWPERQIARAALLRSMARPGGRMAAIRRKAGPTRRFAHRDVNGREVDGRRNCGPRKGGNGRFAFTRALRV